MSTDAPHQGHAAAAGQPTIGRTAAETIAAPSEINTVVASGSSPRLMVAFQPAWQAAANSTAAKTKVSMAAAVQLMADAARTSVTLSPSSDRAPSGAWQDQSP